MAASAIRQRMSGSLEYGAFWFFSDLRLCTVSTASSSARRARPVYTEASRISKFAKIPKMKGSAVGPGGMRRTIRSAGAWAPSSRVAKDWEARMPRTSHSPTVSTPPSRVTKPQTLRGPSSPVESVANVPSRVHTGAMEVKILVPWKE
nr:hypothetical protein DA06_03360 [Georgenia sp. SUBG003]